ncbi:MAG: glycogen synthase GlgA [Geminicoccaceae bacterium]
MQVLSITSEFFPLIKTGGLADVAGALPAALAAEPAAPAAQQVRMRTLLPGYPKVLTGLKQAEPIITVNDLFGGEAVLLSAKAPDGAQLIVIDAPHLYDRPGNPYLGPDGKDWPDNHFRFAALSWIASRIGQGLIEGYRPDVIHGHDWQAALTPVYLSSSASPPATVVTIHNLAFQGVFPATELRALKLPPSTFTLDGLEYWGKISFLKGGLRYADHLTTVSPTYAREICTPDVGMGLDGVLRERRDALTGITNGIDAAVWNPADDPDIEQPFSSRTLKAKAINKTALQTRFNLVADVAAPLFCVVSRLTSQKGFDLLLEALPTLLSHGGQLAMLGSGDATLEAAFTDVVRKNPGRIGAVFGYDEPLSHQMQAGADAILIPSRFEPCGLTQLYGLRYGCLPIVARVGGLADTVIDANQAALTDGVATGFQFAPDSAGALRTALERAFDLYADQRCWQQVQRRAMSRKVDWSVPAKAYADLYRKLAQASVRPA